MSDFFQMKSAKTKKTADAYITDPFLERDELSNIYILTSSLMDQKEIEKLRGQIHTRFGINSGFNLLFSLKFVPTEKDLSGNLEDFFTENSIPLGYSIPPSSIIIAIGRALFSVTHNTDLMVEAFYDTAWNKQWFYDPHTQSVVFPTDEFSSVYSSRKNSFLDCFKTKFFWDQLTKAFVFKSFPKRIPMVECVLVEDTNKFFDDHQNEKSVAWDIETSGTNYMTSKIKCITFSFDGSVGYYLRWEDIDLERLNRFFENKYQIGANLKFDLRFLRHRGISNAKVDFDTLNAGHCLNEMRSNSLKTHAWLYGYWGGYDDDLKKYLKKYPKTNYYDIPEPVLRPYATMDAIVTYFVHERMKEHLLEDKLLNAYFYKDVMPSIGMYLDFELDGVCVNWNRVREVYQELTKELESLRQKIYESFGAVFNLDSSKELGILLEKRGWESFGRSVASVGGYFLTNKKVMLQWKRQGHKEAQLFLEYSEISALLNTFVGEESKGNGLWQYRYPDNKIHPTFWVMLAKSHRNRSSDPNFQNFPKKSKHAKLIRSMFCTPDDSQYSFAETDGAGLQLRIAAAQSGDPTMRKSFIESDGDLHSITAFHTFVKYDDCLIRVSDESGKAWEFYVHEPVSVIRNGEKIEIEAGDLQPEDALC